MTRKPPDIDRRSGLDRRKEEQGPPGVERRRRIEPRKPEVSEVTITDSEWGRLENAVPTPAPKTSR